MRESCTVFANFMRESQTTFANFMRESCTILANFMRENHLPVVGQRHIVTIKAVVFFHIHSHHPTIGTR